MKQRTPVAQKNSGLINWERLEHVCHMFGHQWKLGTFQLDRECVVCLLYEYKGEWVPHHNCAIREFEEEMLKYILQL